MWLAQAHYFGQRAQLSLQQKAIVSQFLPVPSHIIALLEIVMEALVLHDIWPGEGIIFWAPVYV